jgi:hypothetical protein
VGYHSRSERKNGARIGLVALVLGNHFVQLKFALKGTGSRDKIQLLD